MKRLTCALLLFAWACFAQHPKPVVFGRTDGATNASVQLATAISCVDVGSSDAYACNIIPALPAYPTGANILQLWLTPNTANTTDATLNVQTKGAKKILKDNGSALATNDLRAGVPYLLVYDAGGDGGSGAFMLSSLPGNVGGGGAGDVLGAANLTTATRVVKVNAAGTVTETLCTIDASDNLTCPGSVTSPNICVDTKYTIPYDDAALNVSSPTPTKTLAATLDTDVRVCRLEISGTASFTGIANLTAAVVNVGSGLTMQFYGPNQDIFGTVGPTTNNYWSDVLNILDRTDTNVVAYFTFTCSEGDCYASGLTGGSVDIIIGTYTRP